MSMSLLKWGSILNFRKTEFGGSRCVCGGGLLVNNAWDAAPKHRPESQGRYTEAATSWHGQMVGGLDDFWRRKLVSTAGFYDLQVVYGSWNSIVGKLGLSVTLQPALTTFLEPPRNKAPWIVATPCVRALPMFSISPFFLCVCLLSSLSKARSQKHTRPKSLLPHWESQYSGRQGCLLEDLES